MKRGSDCRAWPERSAGSEPVLTNWLIYGATGYTGRLIVRRAVARGLRPILAGRSSPALAELAGPLGLEFRVAPLDDAALARAVDGCGLVLHCAGPFEETSAPMVAACLRAKAHYLDITGEIEVFEALAARSDEARRAGVMLLPGVGFDVVPTDCLAAHLKQRLPSATTLHLGIRARAGLSRGTAATAAASLGRPLLARCAGKIVPVPAEWARRRIDFGRGLERAAALSWGDVSTAWHSTGIPDIAVYFAVNPSSERVLSIAGRLGWLLGAPPVQALLRWGIRRRAPGPTDDERASGGAILWGEVRDPLGRTAAARLRTPEGYTLTAMTAVAAVERVLTGQAPTGFQTPSRAYGADFILEMDGVWRDDLATPC